MKTPNDIQAQLDALKATSDEIESNAATLMAELDLALIDDRPTAPIHKLIRQRLLEHKAARAAITRLESALNEAREKRHVRRIDEIVGTIQRQHAATLAAFTTPELI